MNALLSIALGLLGAAFITAALTAWDYTNKLELAHKEIDQMRATQSTATLPCPEEYRGMPFRRFVRESVVLNAPGMIRLACYYGKDKKAK